MHKRTVRAPFSLVAPTNSGTGGVLERMALPALLYGGYRVERHATIGERPAGGAHIVDLLAISPTHERFLISLKWQQSPGTAEQKVPFEAICLAGAVADSQGLFTRAYLVLGGDGWTLKQWYIGELHEHLNIAEYLSIVSFETFVALTNRRRL